MDADRFDALLRSLAAPPSRRQALRVLMGSALGGLLPLGTLSTDARKGGKGKGKGKKGRGKKGKGKKVAICHDGQTIRVAQPVAKVLLKFGDGKGPCSIPDPPPPTPGPTCAPACRAGMTCVGEQCVVGQGTCPVGTNSCSSSGVVECGLQAQEIPENCQCYVSTEGQTRCADSFGIDGGSFCDECASSAECASLFPAIPGVFCVKVSGTAGECCAPSTRGYCAAPCPTPPACAIPEDCPDPELLCVVATCTNGLCGRAFAAEGTPSSPGRQTAGDCQVFVCDGNGDDRSEPDDTDLPDDGNPCTDNVCTNGAPSHPPLPTGTGCGGGSTCDGAGNCA